MASTRLRFAILVAFVLITIFSLGLRTDSAREKVIVLGENAWEAVVTGVEKGTDIFNGGDAIPVASPVASQTSTVEDAQNAAGSVPSEESGSTSGELKGDDGASQSPLQDEYEAEYSSFER